MGCADLDKSDQLERIDVMRERLDLLEKELMEFDIDAWNQWKDDAKSSMTALKQLESDTISLETAYEIDAYSRLKDNLPGLLIGQQDLLRQVKEGQSRLNKLRKDIEKGNGRRDKYDAFLKSEEEGMKIMEKRFAFYTEVYESIQTEFPEAQESVNQIIAEQIVQ